MSLVTDTYKEDYLLLLEATKRLTAKTSLDLSIEDVMEELKISEEELCSAEDVILSFF